MSLVAAQLERGGADRVAQRTRAVGIRPTLRAAVASVNADEPAISVRSRSKNAALGPELATATYSLIAASSVV